MRVKSLFAALVAAVVAFAAVASAQTNTGEVAGVVKDASGGVLPGATVTATHDVPNRVFGSPDFGRVSSAKNPREMQFGARVVF